MDKINYKMSVTVGRISYINVAPIYYGLDNGLKPSWLKIVNAAPSVLNSMMAKECLDISPVSSVIYAQQHNEWLLLPNLSIACFENVMSVLLVSRLPFDKLHNKKVILSDESAAGRELLKLLFALRKIKPIFKVMAFKNLKDIQKDADAVLVIGDSALREKWSDCYDYVFDLGKMWTRETGLPFVFAVWAVRKSFAKKNSEIVSSIIKLFHISKRQGIQNIQKIAVSSAKKLGINNDVCKSYYDKLCYDLHPIQINGIETFFRYLYEAKIFSEEIKLCFFQNDRNQ